MIIDSHTHAWPRWPYQPPVPDDESRGKVEQLLHEMDLHDVEKAILICARIDRNPENNDYVAACVKRYPDRLIQFADVDCSWTDTYHTDGAAERLKTAAETYALKGYTHYLRGDDDGTWFFSEEGQRFFQTTAELGLIASIAMGSHQHEALRKLAAQFPTVPILCHHMGGARAGEETPISAAQAGTRLSRRAEYPHQDVRFRLCLAGSMGLSAIRYTLDRPCSLRTLRTESSLLGSDYPVVRNFMTYQHALEAFRTHCPFIPEADKTEILGGTLQRLLSSVGK